MRLLALIAIFVGVAPALGQDLWDISGRACAISDYLSVRPDTPEEEKRAAKERCDELSKAAMSSIIDMGASMASEGFDASAEPLTLEVLQRELDELSKRVDALEQN